MNNQKNDIDILYLIKITYKIKYLNLIISLKIQY